MGTNIEVQHTKFQVKPTGPSTASTLVFKTSDEAGVESNTLSEEAWLNEDNIANVTFTVKPARDNTTFAHRSNRNPARSLAEQYLSAPCEVNVRTSKGLESIPVLALTNVRILAQASTRGQSGGYGTEFVRMALPSRYVEALRKGLASSVAILDPPIENSSKKTAESVSYVAFTVNIANCPVEVEDSKDSRTELSLSTIMNSHPNDVVASVMFGLSLKYKGKMLDDVSKARYHISLTPSKIFLSDLADYSVDPTPAGLTRVSDAVLPVEAKATKKLTALMAKLGVEDAGAGNPGSEGA